MRGLAAIIFFGLHLFVFIVLIDERKERYMAAILGAATAFIIRWIVGGLEGDELWSDSITSTPWKMGVGFGVTIWFVYILGKFIKNKRALGLLTMMSSPIHLLLNARSLFLTTFLASFSTLFKFKTRSKRKQKIIIFIIMSFIFIGEPIATGIYGKLTESGIFGAEAQKKYLQQTAGGKINILLAGRSESLVSLVAIADSPLFGHGSWAESKYYYFLYLKSIENLGKNVNWDYAKHKNKYLIPSHSMLFGTWVYHGVIGAVFWIYILFLSLKVLSKNIFGEISISVIEMMILYALIWDIFFSPFGEARRCIEAVYIVVICVILNNIKSYNKKQLKKYSIDKERYKGR